MVSLDTIPARLMKQAETKPHQMAYCVKTGDRWESTSWRVYVEEVRSVAKAFMKMGLQPGEKVAMLGFNRPEWTTFHLAALSIGSIGVGIYTTCSAEEVQYIVHHSETRFILLENEHQWQKIDAQRQNLPQLERAVLMRGAPTVDDPLVDSWDQFNERGREVPESELDTRTAAINMDDIAVLIYTSGTTGPPKGVMLSHSNLAWTASQVRELINVEGDDCLLSYLPLSHIAEQMLTVYIPCTTGTTIYYAESIHSVADNLREVQPTVIFGVPRIWEKFHAALTSRLSEAKGLRGALVNWAGSVAGQYHKASNRGETVGPHIALQYRLANRIVLGKIKTALGLSRTRLCVSGAAPIAKEILDFFTSLDIVIHEIYGQSEDSGPTSFNFIGRTKFGTVGQPVPGVEVKIAEDGEILVRGQNVFQGYYKDEAATKDTLVDGWLHSGDLGMFDEEGFLNITGRKKDIIITAGGKNIAPKNIESALKNSQLISEAVVVGDRRKYLTALITLDEEAIEKFAQERNLPTSGLEQTPELQREIQAVVDEVNSHLAQVETIKKFTVLPENFSIDNGELTPTLKVKRKVVNERYKDRIDQMYG